MYEAHFTAQHLYRITLLSPTHLHVPKIIRVPCTILKKRKKKKEKKREKDSYVYDLWCRYSFTKIY